MIEHWFLEYTDLYLSKWLSSPPTFGGWRGGMVALSHLPTFLGVEQKYLNGGLVDHWMVIGVLIQIFAKHPSPTYFTLAFCNCIFVFCICVLLFQKFWLKAFPSIYFLYLDFLYFGIFHSRKILKLCQAPAMQLFHIHFVFFGRELCPKAEQPSY